MAATMGGAVMAPSSSQAWLCCGASRALPQQFLCRAIARPCDSLRLGTKARTEWEWECAHRQRPESLRLCRLGPPSAIHFGSRLCGRERSEFGSLNRSSATRGRSRVVAQARKDGVEAPERILAALGYVLPLFDGIQYGRYFFLQYPVAEVVLRPLYPLLAAYKGFPYSNFIAFFSLYLLVVRNQSISRYVRFNAMQAVVLDVLLILPTLVERTFAPSGGVGFELLIIFYNTVFLFLLTCFTFGVVSCILGRTPRLPIVADAADAQV